MATKRNQAKRTGSSGTPGWIWLIAGLILGAVLLMVFVPGAMKKQNADDFFHANTPKPNADAKPAPADSDDDAPVAAAASKPAAAAAASAGKPTQYEFYDALTSGKEVVISDADLAKRTRAEEAAAKQHPDTPDANAQPAANVAPKPLDEAAAVQAPAAAQAASTPAAALPARAASTDAGNGAHYLLQAGAFGASGDAEALKAKIAFLGLNARVESAAINGKTVYRVRMGPYGSASELSDAKRKLSGGGLPAVAIKAQ